MQNSNFVLFIKTISLGALLFAAAAQAQESGGAVEDYFNPTLIDPNEGGTFYPIIIEGFAPPVWEPIIQSGTSGGVRDAKEVYSTDSLGNDCVGYIASRPDHIMRLPDGAPDIALRTRAYGQDTTLVIAHPDTGSVYCDDDSSSDTGARLSLTNLTPGRYEIYVGSYDFDTFHSYDLYVYE